MGRVIELCPYECGEFQHFRGFYERAFVSSEVKAVSCEECLHVETARIMQQHRDMVKYRRRARLEHRARMEEAE